jgi:hypothetical protein
MTDAQDKQERPNEGKYGDLIKKARQQKKQLPSKPADQITKTPDEPSNSQIASKPADQITSEREVNLCCKVPESWRRHWAAEAKRNGLTLTEIIMEAFTTKFGLPENHKE